MAGKNSVYFVYGIRPMFFPKTGKSGMYFPVRRNGGEKYPGSQIILPI